MGWWKIKNVETGQIDWDTPSSRKMPDKLPIEDEELQKILDADIAAGGGFLVNAIPGENTPENHYNGDGPADLITMGLNRVELLLSIDRKNVNKKALEPLFFGHGYKEAVKHIPNALGFIPQDISWQAFDNHIRESDDVQVIVMMTWLIIRGEYLRAWEREPYPEELRAVFNFCTNNRYKGK